MGKLASISLDTTDPATLAEFYGRPLGISGLTSVRRAASSPSRTAPSPSPSCSPPTTSRRPGPTPVNQQQLKVAVAVTDLSRAVMQAVNLGATEAQHQPMPEVWRVLIDPAGHPFCLTTATTKLDL